MKISRKRTIQASPEAIWKAISTVESLPEWVSGVEAAVYLSGPAQGKGRRQRVTTAMYQRSVETEQEVEEWSPCSRLVVAHLRGTTGGRELAAVKNFRMAVDLAPAPGKGTEVSVAYTWNARFGLPWLLSLLFGGRVMGRELSGTLRKIEALVAR